LEKEGFILLRKNKGFFLLELLLSLSAWFMLCLFFIPLLIDLKIQSQQLEVHKKAEQLLYEELQASIVDGQKYLNYSVSHQGIEYRIEWRDLSLSGQKEVCVKVEKHSFISKTEMCATPE
jgi:competence protein ComGC